MTRRLVGAALGLVLAMLMVLGIPFMQTVERYERDRLRLDLVRDAVVLGANVEDQLSEGKPSDTFTTTVVKRYATRTGARVVIVDRRGVVFADSAPTMDQRETARTMSSRPEFAEALKGNFSTVTRYSQTLRQSSLYVAVPVSSAGKLLGAVRVSFSTDQVNQRIAVQRTRLLGLGILAALVVSILGGWLARWVARPVSELREATAAFGNDSLKARARTDRGPDDIRALAVEFNAMADRLQTFVDTQNAFVADASHELRTPLTAIRLQLEMMEYATPELIDDRRNKALREVVRLSRNVDGLLVLGRQQTNHPPSVQVDVAPIIASRTAFWQTLIEENDLRLIENIEPDLRALATPERVGTVIDNLIANAIDASPPGSTITVSARLQQRTVEIHVTDDGPGMNPEQRIAAFDRFWRAPPGKGNGGSGLGLAIARKLVDADHATIRLDASPPHGIDAVLSYPRDDR